MSRTTQIRFPGGAGYELAGTIVEPRLGHARGWALFSHCFTCSRNYKVAVNVSRVLAEHGWGVLRYDFTGLGESGGKFEDTNFSTNLADLKSAADHLAANYGEPQLLIGHSLGGLATLASARSVPGARCLVTISSPSRTRKLGGLFSDDDLAAWRADPEAVRQVEVSGRPMPFKGQFHRDLETHELEPLVAGLHLPLLIFHSPVDRTTKFHHAESLYAAAPEPKSLVSLGDADHLVSKREDAEMVGRIIAAWAERYRH